MGISIRKLNAGVAIGAASLAQVPGVALADSETTSMTLEGGASLGEFTREKVGAPEGEIDRDMGLYGSVETVRSISPGWDWSVGATGMNFAPTTETNEVENSGSYPSAINASNEFDARFVNFDIGRNMQMSGVDLRFAAGVEAISTSENKGLSLVDSDQYVDITRSRDFIGLGPRISGDASMALGDGSPFSLYGGASAAMTRGSLTIDKGLSSQGVPELSEIIPRESRSETASLFHGALDAGVQYSVNDRTSFRAGLRRDIFRFDSALTDDIGAEETITSDTAYVGVSISF